jgi:hypothetical protein
VGEREHCWKQTPSSRKHLKVSHNISEKSVAEIISTSSLLKVFKKYRENSSKANGINYSSANGGSRNIFMYWKRGGALQR